ncbi:type I polyketide synthase [Actinokineospora sp.]|uniref:type I polyketide synthase n=1 Tax=Actinokineospora sp. TaxID=1872133 RepID=UPI00403841DA
MPDETAPDPDELRAAVQRQQATIRALMLEKYEPIAIVGIGLRFPGGSETPAEFADFLREGRSGIVPLPRDRWDADAFVARTDDDKGKIRAENGGYLDRLDLFDAPFFNISPKEAQYMDPQQRLLLETSWAALEHANIDPTPLRKGNGGVYVGASSIDYAFEMDQLSYPELDGHLASGVTFFPLSGRLSYFLGWHGPCLTVDTACASGLTAIHLAVKGLRAGECEIALAGGVNALHHPRTQVIFSAANMLAKDGQCKTFDEAADGYARAEGCGVLVLKRLSDARRDGDTVLALIRGTSVGQDGDSAGLTVPNGPAQEKVMRAAIAAAALDPGDINYVEAHGTGTPLGDPIEMGAIADVFAQSHTKDAPIVVGSVKTNLGHMEPVAGVVGVIKAVLQLREGKIFPHLNYTNPSGRIPWASYPVEIPTEVRPWVSDIKRALVNSFGFGGTISAAVVEQAPPVAEPAVRPMPAAGEVFALSAKNRRSLKAQLERYRDFVADHPDTDLGDLCRTVSTGRSHFSLRVAGIARDHAELTAFLDRQLAALEDGKIGAGESRKIAFLFTGQGSQYAGMGVSLYRDHPVFAARLDECDRLFAPLLGCSVRDLVLGTALDGKEKIDQTRYTQAALFALEYALAQLWMSWGARPTALIGHSIGEVVAAAVAGLFTLPDAVQLVAARGRLMQSVTAPGGMAAVSAPAEDVLPVIEGYADLAMAAYNAPTQCVVSGGRDSLAEVTATLTERGLKVKQLAVSHAFHSPLMTEVFDEFRAALKGIAFHEPRLTLISNLTGKVARVAQISDPEYWIRHIGAAVNFAAGMKALERRGKHVFIEVGPSGALTSLAKKCVDATEHRWLTSVNPKDPEGETVRKSVAQLYTSGATVAWARFHGDRAGTRLTLPTYAFDRKRYWLPEGKGAWAGRVQSGHPLLGAEVRTEDGTREFRAQLTGEPALLDLLFAVQDTVFGELGRPITGIRFTELPSVADGEPLDLRTVVTVRADGGADVRVLAGPEDRVVVTASIGAEPGASIVGDESGTVVSLSGVEIGAGDHLPPLDDLWRAIAPEPGEFRPMRVRAVRVMKKPRAEQVRAVVRVSEPELVDEDLVADVVLYEGDRAIAELSGVGLRRVDQGTPGHFLHRMHWVPMPATDPTSAPAPRHVLVLGRDADPALAASAEVAGVRLTFGASHEHIAEVLREGEPTDVAWFWRALDGSGVEGLRAENEHNYTELLAALNTLSENGFGRGQRLWLVTERAQVLPGDDAAPAARLAASTLWGFGQVLLNEFPTYRPTLVDLAGPHGVDGLLEELRSKDIGDFQVAYRDGTRYARRLRPYEPESDVEGTRAVEVRDDRTYLITGGLGALGLVTASKLVDLGARHIALVGRRGKPADDATEVWENLHGRAKVTVYQGDLGDAADIARIFGELAKGDHPVGGVVHAAGGLADAPIPSQTWASIDGLFGPKVYGTWLLHEATKDLPELDFFVAFSSAASVVGGVSQSNYAAANAYLDQLCHWRAAQGLPALAVNWGPWSEVGMSARLSDLHVKALEHEGVKFFTPAKALRALAILLRRTAPQVAGGEVDWERFMAAKPVASALYSELATFTEGADSGLDLDELRGLPREERVATIRDFIRTTVARILQIEDIGDVEPTAEFVRLGMDSLASVDLKNTLESAVRMPLPSGVTFDYPTPTSLAEFVDRNLSGTPAAVAA